MSVQKANKLLSTYFSELIKDNNPHVKALPKEAFASGMLAGCSLQITPKEAIHIVITSVSEVGDVKGTFQIHPNCQAQNFSAGFQRFAEVMAVNIAKIKNGRAQDIGADSLRTELLRS